MNNDLREELAALAHEQWSGWMKYLFERDLVFSVERMMHQMKTPYINLSEEEKNRPRKEADKFLKVFEDHMQRLAQLGQSFYE